MQNNSNPEAASRRLRLVRILLYGGTGLFFLGAIIWAVITIQQTPPTPTSLPSAIAVIPPAAVPQALATPLVQDEVNEESAEEVEDEETENEEALLTECRLSIPAISLDLPICAYYSEEKLAEALCKFSGPQPGNPGNYVIAGHNFLSGAHFTRLHELGIGDNAILTGQDGTAHTYTVVPF